MTNDKKQHLRGAVELVARALYTSPRLAVMGVAALLAILVNRMLG